MTKSFGGSLSLSSGTASWCWFFKAVAFLLYLQAGFCVSGPVAPVMFGDYMNGKEKSSQHMSSNKYI